MRPFLAFAAGLLLVTASLTLAGAGPFYALACTYAYALFLLFFGRELTARWFLAGVTVAAELLGTSRLGLATAVSALMLALYHVFYERLRFTSAYLRYIVSLAAALFAFCLITYSADGAVPRLLALIPLYGAICLIAYLAVVVGRTERYELL